MNDLAEQLIKILREKNYVLTTAESCTGGLLSSTITDIPGASDIFDRGFITYSNQAKQDTLKVSSETLNKHGAVSNQTAAEMAQGALQNSNADIAISITGIAGPKGGTDEKPIGTVYIGHANQQEADSVHYRLTGTRAEIRQQSCEAAFKQLINCLSI